MKYRRSNQQAGFTLVELLIVIVIIAILAAISIISYNGIQARAHAVVAQSDLRNAASLMANDYAVNGTYPASVGEVNSGKGLPTDATVAYSFHSTGTAYCITATSNYNNVGSYYISSDTGGIQQGKCPQDAGAQVTTLIGNYSGYAESPSTPLVNSPSGLTAYGGNLYFLDSSSPRLREVTPAGATTFIAGTSSSAYAEGTGSAAKFNWPQALTADSSGNLYIADTTNNRIREVTPSGVSSLVAGTGSTTTNTNTACATVTFNAPRGIVYYSGVLYVADSNNHTIRAITLSGCTVATFAGTSGSGTYADGTGAAARFKLPEGLAVDTSGNIYVADTNNNRIRKITQTGVVTTIAGNGTAGSADGTGGASGTAEFNAPQALAVGTDGTIYVADTANNTIRKITTDGTVTTAAGNGTAGYEDGQGASGTEFNHPNGIALIGSTLYVADTSSNRIRAITNF